MAISKQGAKRAGKRFEWSTRDDLEANGYKVVMSAGSLSPCDMVAVKYAEVLFVQCKAGVEGGGTPGLISPAERLGLLQFVGLLPGVGKAIVAYQVKDGRRHVRRYRRLMGLDPDKTIAWTPDEVIS